MSVIDVMLIITRNKLFIVISVGCTVYHVYVYKHDKHFIISSFLGTDVQSIPAYARRPNKMAFMPRK